MTALPTEVLGQIFSLAVPRSLQPVPDFASKDWNRYLKALARDDAFDTIAPRNLAGVCRFWRDVAVSTKRLWAQWYIDMHHPSDTILRSAASFVLQCLDHSGGLPLTSVVRLHCDAPRPYGNSAASDFLAVLTMSQRRWERADIQCRYTKIDVFDLAISPLKELVLKNCAVGLTASIESHNSSGTRLLEQLAVLHILNCHSADDSTILLLAMAPNLEEVVLTGFAYRKAVGLFADGWPHVRLERLRRLFLEGVLPDAFLQVLTCPALEELTFVTNDNLAAPFLISFIQRSLPRCLDVDGDGDSDLDSEPSDAILRSLCISAASFRNFDFPRVLHLLPALTSLSIGREIDWAWLDALAKREKPRGLDSECPSASSVRLGGGDDFDFALCPLLKEVTIGGGSREGLIRFIESRWCAPASKRHIARVCWENSYQCPFPANGDPALLTGTWEPVGQYVREGLRFEKYFSEMPQS